MIIVVNTSTQNSHTNSFVVDCFIQLALQQPTNQFIFLVQNEHSITQLLPNNCSTFIIGRKPKAVLLRKYWYNYKIPSILKKLNATICVNTNAIISLRTNVPQFLFLENLNLKESTYLFSSQIKKYYKKNSEANLAKAEKIIVISEEAKEKLCTTFLSLQNNVNVLPIAANTVFMPSPWQHQEETKNTISNGKDYFLVATNFTDEQYFINLLKAFTQFKKWQKSNLQLLIVTQKNKLTNTLTQQLANYKYKEDVQLLANITISEYAKIVSAAYAFFYPFPTTNFPIQILEAMQSHVPVITQIENSIENIFADAVGYAKSIDIAEYSAKMILLYKDENYRNELIQKGVAFNFSYNWDKTLDELAKTVLQTQSNK
jgi:hypothetical protein